MGFKLVRVDTAESYKVTLRLGSHLIGRGKLLNCNDNRVSRNHAELIVTSDSILLKSLHQNPCFVKKKSLLETLILSQPESQVLTNGDQFGLIPDHYWYEVIKTLEDDSMAGIDSQQVSNKPENDQINQDATQNGGNTQVYDQEAADDDEDDINCSQSVLAPENQTSSIQVENESSKVNQSDNLDNMDTSQKQGESINQPEPLENLLNELDQNNQSISPTQRLHFENESPTFSQNVELSTPLESEQIESNNGRTSPNKRLQFELQINQAVGETNQSSEPDESANNQNATPNKRIHSEDETPLDVKRIKTEPETPDKDSDNKVGSNEESSSNQAIKQEPASSQDAKPGPSNVQDCTTAAGPNAPPPQQPSSPTKPPNNPLRERCWYGANCYRKNPQHLAQFSHPADADWGSGPQAACPWGAGCRRADPRHWRDHHHPPGARPRLAPPRPPGRRQQRQRSASPQSGSDSDSDQANANLIVAGKRARRPVARQGWSESEEEDPYRTDESDEWDPNDGSQDSGVHSQDF